MKRIAIALFAVLCLTAPTVGVADAKPKVDKSKGLVSTMVRNLYLGADLAPAINSTGAADFISKNGQILRDVDTNNMPVRAKGLAAEIKDKSPDLVGLQEVALWRTGPASLQPPISGVYTASDVRVDNLAELMKQLNKGKKRYRIVSVQNEFDFEAPADLDNDPGTGVATLGGEINGRLTMRDAILAKVGSGIQVKNRKSANFDTIYQPVVSGIPVDVERGWLSADVKVRKSPWFRFVNTHLEAFGEPTIRETQAKELLAGPLKSGKMPAVLVGDLNSDDDTVEGDDRLAYNALKKGGMVERGFSGQPTFGIPNGIIVAGNGKKSDFTQFIDHVMTNKPKRVKKVNASVTGLKPERGYWNSDHAGVFSQLRIR
jgi:endonuclease/exonuclease/phosphatase family metal-dependent hydrolase